MGKENSLFRPEALQHKNAEPGDFTVSAPSVLPIALWSTVGVLMVAILLLFTTYADQI